jgi:Flp pilus assembly protein TadG
MMIQQHSRQRHGAATVEMAFVSILFFMMLFGIFEYGRLLYVMHLANNAARDAARFAAVHTGGPTMPSDPITFGASDLINLTTTGQIGSEFIGTGMSGMTQNIQNYTVNIFTVDPVALQSGVVQPLASSQWNSATFNNPIAVTVSGTYNPVLPSLLFMNASIPFQVTVFCSSEAN